MRAILVAMIIAAGVAMLGSGGASAVPANGAAILQASDQTGQVIAVAGGCGSDPELHPGMAGIGRVIPEPAALG